MQVSGFFFALEKNKMNELINLNSVQTMSSLEISELVGSKHANVRISIERLIKQGVISSYAVQTFKNINNLDVQGYGVSKRDSYVIVAQLSPEFTGRLVDRWQDLEAKQNKPLTIVDYARALVASHDKIEALEQAERASIEALSYQRNEVKWLEDRLEKEIENKKLYGWEK